DIERSLGWQEYILLWEDVVYHSLPLPWAKFWESRKIPCISTWKIFLAGRNLFMKQTVKISAISSTAFVQAEKNLLWILLFTAGETWTTSHQSPLLRISEV